MDYIKKKSKNHLNFESKVLVFVLIFCLGFGIYCYDNFSPTGFSISGNGEFNFAFGIFLIIGLVVFMLAYILIILCKKLGRDI